MEELNNTGSGSQQELSTVRPIKKPDYTSGYEAPAKEAVFSAEDVYAAGKLTPVKEKSIVESILKGILGACIGAIPGFLLWILIGKIGFIASICGMLLAVGAVGGCIFATKDDELSPTAIGIICVCVIVFTIYLAEKIVWCWAMSDEFQKVRQELYMYGDGFGLEKSEVDRIIKDEYGFTEGSFGDFFSNFGKTLDNLEMKTRYYKHMAECYGIAALGGVAFLAKLFKTNCGLRM